MSWDAFSALLDQLLELAKSIVVTSPEVNIDAVARAWLMEDFWERARIAYPFLTFQSICEEYASLPQPTPEAQQYWALAGGSPQRFAVEYVTCPTCVSYAGESVREVSLQPREFMMRLALYVSYLYQVMPPSARLGELCKLGFYSVRMLESWFSGEIYTDYLLSWLGGVLAKNSMWSVLREAIYVFPWIKRWLTESWLSYACEHYAHSLNHFVAELARFAVDVLAFLDILALSAIASYAPLLGIEGGPRGASTFCSFLRVASALSRVVEAGYSCVEPAVEEVCSALRNYYASMGRPRFGDTMYRYCRDTWSALFSSPSTLLEFTLAYYGATNPMALHRAYQMLSEVSGVPLYAIRRIFAAARALGQWGYPRYLGGGL